MAIFSFNEPFNYMTTPVLNGLAQTEVTPDAVNPDMQFVAKDSEDHLSFLVQGSGYRYSDDGTPIAGTTNEVALYLTTTGDVPVKLLFSADQLNIPYNKLISYFFKSPADILKDVLSKNDVVKGSSGDDTLAGFAGRDHLSGRGGSDTFYFTEKPKDGQFDVITDFNQRSDTGHTDKLALDASMFGNLTNIDKAFVDITSTGFSNLGDDAHILYNQKSGALYYDADGHGKDNAGQPILIAILQAGSSKLHPHLDSGDFLLV